MSNRITPSKSPSSIADSGKLCASTKRAQNIEDYLLSKGGSKGLDVVCDPRADTAYIEQDTYEESPLVVVPARDFQTIGSVPQEAANRLLQYGLALHEHGHDRYTPLPYLTALFDRRQFELGLSDFYWDIVNALEDFRVEAALIADEGEWAEQRLDYVNLNFVYTDPQKVHRPESISWDAALLGAAIHYGKARERFDLIPLLEDDNCEKVDWADERAEQIYHWVLPELKHVASDIKTTPDGEAAAQEMLEFIDRLDGFLSTVLDRNQPETNEQQRDDVSPESDDRSNDIGGQKETADSLEPDPDSNSDSDSDSGSESGSGNGQDEEESSESGSEQPESANGDESSAGDSTGGGEESGDEDESAGDDAVSENGDSDGDGGEGGESQEGDGDAGQEGEEQGTSDEKPGSTSLGESDSENADDGDGIGNNDVEGDGTQTSEPPSSGHETGGENSESDTQESEDESSGGSKPNDGGEPGESQESTQNQTERESEPSEEMVDEEMRKVAQETQSKERAEQELEAEIELLQQALQGGNGDVDSLKMVEQAGQEGDVETWDEILRLSVPLVAPLRQQLERSQQTSSQRGVATGKFDSGLAHRLAANNLSVNKRRRDGDEKQYSVTIVLDRSGSMRSEIETAEIATGAFAKGLMDLGIDVSIIDLYQTEARLVKPFGQSLEQVRGHLTSHDVGGLTPLSDALVVSRERVLLEPHFPFMFVVSDGKPGDQDRYLSELEMTPFPVAGVTLSASGQKEYDEFYDVHRSATPDTIGNKLVDLASSVMF